MNHEERQYWNAEKEKKEIAASAPVSGLNTNLEFMGKQLHIQTENVKLPSAHIITQVFSGGRVVLSKIREHPPEIRNTGDPGKIQELMRSQHFQIIGEIREKQARLNRDASRSGDGGEADSH